MKNIYEILKEFGLEVPEEKRSDFDKAWKENYQTKPEYDNAVAKRDEYKASIDAMSEKLKEFEGIDLNDMKGKIASLTKELEDKEKEYSQKEAERIFDDTLTEAIKAAGGRNAKSVKALLDIASLKDSKDQTEDIKKALEAVKESDAYLFGADEPFANPVGATGGGQGAGEMGNLSTIRAAMGLPESNKK